MSSSSTPLLGQVLRAHAASGELSAARMRVALSGVALFLVAVSAGSNNVAANCVLGGSMLLSLAYALSWWRWRARSAHYAPWMSYASVAIDITLCQALAIAALLNDSGAYEVYRSPMLWLALAAINGLTALRGSPRVSQFALGLTLAYGALLLAWVYWMSDVVWVSPATYVGPGLNLIDVIAANLFAVIPALIAERVARRERDLVVDTAKREQKSSQEREQLEWRLKVADRMVTVGTMAAGVAHEVNNPLTYVLLNIDMAAHRLRDESHLADVRAYLTSAQSGAQRVQAIVGSLRTFSRVEDGPHQPVDLRSTIDAALTMASSELRHRAQVHVQQEERFAVLGSEAKLGQVFLNLIVNAAQAITEPDPNRQRIGIALYREQDCVVVEVSDTGSGIAPEHLGRIFDPFFTTKPVGTGTGLGLSICHSIIADLSGSIDVRSTPGEGTTFSVRLPICERMPTRTSSIQTIPPRKGGKVLVIDDDSLVAEAVAVMLAEEHEVVLAASAEEALERLRAGARFDAVLCDLMMPRMSGIELYFEVESDFPELAPRMLFATGGAFSRPAQSFIERMGSRVLSKPFSSDDLRSKIRQVVAGAAAPASAHVDARKGAAHQ